MPRIPPWSMLFLAGLLPAWVGALGLGEVVPKSFLNQPFLAEIPITAATPDELSALRVTLASPETFDRYGLARPTFLGEMRFAVIDAGRGPAIRITSAQPVVEPFVTLLVDLYWPQGRLLREYTVLLDPPAFAGTAVARPSESPAASASPPGETARAPERNQAAPAASVSPMAARSAAGGPGTDYGPVARNETLWGIANRNRAGSDVDVNQLMLAIFRANPDAFVGNINRLRAGSVLRIPGTTELSALGRRQALVEVQRQNALWQQGTATQAAASGRLRLVPPSESASRESPDLGKGGASQKELQTELDESRRQLAVKDDELAALRAQLAAATQKGRSGVGAEAPITAPPSRPAPTPSTAVQTTPPTAPSISAAPAQPPSGSPRATTAPPPASDEESGGLISGLFSNVWLWVTALLVLTGGVFLARRRGVARDPKRWTPRVAPGTGADESPARRRGARDDAIVVEERRPVATGSFERSSPGMAATAQLDAELPLERTISADAPVNLDQSDPIAEADFHMAYGLYDQAADLLTAAAAREPARKDLKLKLLEVCFVWENRQQFLKEAREFRNRVQSDTDPDWKRIALMGKQLAPQDPLFAAAAAAGVTSEDIDLTLSASGPGSVDVAFSEENDGIDFDLSSERSGGDEALDFDFAAPTTNVRRPRRDEAPTVLASELDGASTTESPTVEASYAGTPTVETPTLETAMGDRTLESPTLESRLADGGATARLRGASRSDDAASDQTEEIDLDELGLDLTGLDEAARDMSTGLQPILPPSTSLDGEALDLDLSNAASTAEMRQLTGAQDSPTLNEKPNRRTDEAQGDDTAEHQRSESEDSKIMRGIEVTGKERALGLDPDRGHAQQDMTSTGMRALRGRSPEDATMTEVGTKLDLARAYLDMGDPDGARSILSEVLEEGDDSQRSEAQKLLDGIGR